LTVSGSFVYAPGDGSLWLQAASGGAPSTLVERSTESIAQLPAFAPGGTRVVYSALLFLPGGDLRGDIREIDLAGENARTLIAADASEIVYLYPRVARDGRLLVTRAEQLQTTRERASLEWVSEKGERTSILDRAQDGDVSPDGARLVFVRYDVPTMGSSLWLADAEGKNPQELVEAATFTAIQSPRFSPDGAWVAFSAHGSPQKPLPRVRDSHSPRDTVTRESGGCALELFSVCLLSIAQAHNAPGALWAVHIASRKFLPLTDIYDDTPMPAWSPDGSRVAIHDSTGIRLIDLARREIYPLFPEDGGSGGFDWASGTP
jgi:Tol biopolymer transport system component